MSDMQRSRTRSRTRRRVTQGGVSFCLGWVVIFVQLLGDPARVNLAFLILAGGLVGVPFAVPTIAAIRGSGSADSTLPLSSLSSSSSPGDSGDIADE